MTGFNMYIGPTRNFDITTVIDQKKPSFIPNMDDLKKTKKPQKIKKKVNTKVPKQVLTAFLMYCVRENQFRKEAFTEMLRQFFHDPQEQSFAKVNTINGKPIDFKELEEANFEFDLELFSEVQAFKVVNRLTYIDIYTQVIVQFLTDKLAQNKMTI